MKNGTAEKAKRIREYEAERLKKLADARAKYAALPDGDAHHMERFEAALACCLNYKPEKMR